MDTYGSKRSRGKLGASKPPKTPLDRSDTTVDGNAPLDGRHLHRIEKTIEVDAPLRTCYNQWTQFETFPQFMEGIIQVEQLDQKRLHWVAEIAGDRKEWDAEIVDQVPDSLITWRSTSGEVNHGSVSFAKIEPGRCRITLLMTYQPKGLKERIGDAIGLLSARVEGDLQRFKKFIETRRHETGAWRGEIEKGRVRTHRKLAREGESLDLGRGQL